MRAGSAARDDGGVAEGGGCGGDSDGACDGGADDVLETLRPEDFAADAAWGGGGEDAYAAAFHQWDRAAEVGCKRPREGGDVRVDAARGGDASGGAARGKGASGSAAQPVDLRELLSRRRVEVLAWERTAAAPASVSIESGGGAPELLPTPAALA